MSNQLDIYMKRLPPFIGKFIFSFLIPDQESIEFGDYRRTLRDNYGYSLRYEVAFRDNCLLENFKGIYLSRIKKNNGKHRYYLTTENATYYCQGCGMEGCRSEYCRGGWEYDKTYDSKYVGKDFENALLILILNLDLKHTKKEQVLTNESSSQMNLLEPNSILVEYEINVNELSASDW